MSIPEEQDTCWICQCGPADAVGITSQFDEGAAAPSSASIHVDIPTAHAAPSQPAAAVPPSAHEAIVTDRCLCVGVMSRVHISCLNEWVLSRGHKACDLCGAEYNIMTVAIPDSPEAAMMRHHETEEHIGVREGVRAAQALRGGAAAARVTAPRGVLTAWRIYTRYALRWTRLALTLVWHVLYRLVGMPIMTGICARGVLIEWVWLPAFLRVSAFLSGADDEARHDAFFDVFALTPRPLGYPNAAFSVRHWVLTGTRGSTESRAPEYSGAHLSNNTVKRMGTLVLNALSPVAMRRFSGASDHIGLMLLQCFCTGSIISLAVYTVLASWWTFTHTVPFLDTVMEAWRRERAQLLLPSLSPPARRLARLSLSIQWWSQPLLLPDRQVYIFLGAAKLCYLLGGALAVISAVCAWCAMRCLRHATGSFLLEAVYMGPPAEDDPETGQPVDATERLQRLRSTSLHNTAPAGSSDGSPSHAPPPLGRRRRRALEHQRRAHYGACRTVVLVRGADYAFVQREIVRWLHLAVCPWLVGVCVQAVTWCVLDWSLPLFGGAAVVWGEPALLCGAPARTWACAVMPSLDVLTVCGHWVAGAVVLLCATRLVVGPALGSVVSPRVMQDWLGLVQTHPLDVRGVDACAEDHWVRGNVRRERRRGGGAGLWTWVVDTAVYVVPRELCRVLCRVATCVVLVGVPTVLLWVARRGFGAVVPVSAQYDSRPRLPLWTLGAPDRRGGGLSAHTAALHNHSFVDTARSLYATFLHWSTVRRGPEDMLSLWGLLLTVVSGVASAALTVLMVGRRWLWSSVLLLAANGLSWSQQSAPPANALTALTAAQGAATTGSSSALARNELGVVPGGWQMWTLLTASVAWSVLYVDLCPTAYYVIKATHHQLHRLAAAHFRLPQRTHAIFVPPAQTARVRAWVAKTTAAMAHSAVHSVSLEALCPEAVALFYVSPPYRTRVTLAVKRGHNAAALHTYVARSKTLQRRLRQTVAKLESQERKMRQLVKEQQGSLRDIRKARERPTRDGVTRSPPPSRHTPPLLSSSTPASASSPPSHRSRSVGGSPRWRRRCRYAASGAWRRVRLLCFLLCSLVWLSLLCFAPLVCVMAVLADVVPHGLLLLTLSLTICGTVGNVAIAYVSTLLLACFPTFVMLLGFMHYASFLHGLVRAVTAEEDALSTVLEALYEMRRLVGPHPGNAAVVAQRSAARAAREEAQPHPTPTAASHPWQEEVSAREGTPTLPTLRATDSMAAAPTSSALTPPPPLPPH